MKLKLDDNGNVVVQEKDGVKMPVYVDADGKDVVFDAASTVGTIKRLNGEAKTNRERAETAEGTLATFKGITDPAAAIKALATVKNLDDKKLVDAGEVEKVKLEAIKATEEKYKPTLEERDALKVQLETHLIGGAFSGSKFIAEKFAAEGPAGVEIARALFSKRFKVEDGKVVAYNESGEKVFSKSRPGEIASPEEAIELLVDAYPHKDHILKSSGHKGTGAHGGNGNGNPPKGNLGGSKAERTAALAARYPELNQ